MTPHKIDLDLNFLDQKNYGPQNSPLGCNLGHKFPPPGWWSLGRKQNDDIAVQYMKMSMYNNTEVLKQFLLTDVPDNMFAEYMEQKNNWHYFRYISDNYWLVYSPIGYWFLLLQCKYDNEKKTIFQKYTLQKGCQNNSIFHYHDPWTFLHCKFRDIL